jgi:hypothetical protein
MAGSPARPIIDLLFDATSTAKYDRVLASIGIRPDAPV